MSQVAGSVDTQPVPTIQNGGPGLDRGFAADIQGTPVDTGATCFPTVPSGFNANHHYYPGLIRGYLVAAYTGPLRHHQIQYRTEDIVSPQLGIQPPISPEVLIRWQLAQTSGVSLAGTAG